MLVCTQNTVQGSVMRDPYSMRCYTCSGALTITYSIVMQQVGNVQTICYMAPYWSSHTKYNTSVLV